MFVGAVVGWLLGFFIFCIVSHGMESGIMAIQPSKQPVVHPVHAVSSSAAHIPKWKTCLSQVFPLFHVFLFCTLNFSSSSFWLVGKEIARDDKGGMQCEFFLKWLLDLQLLLFVRWVCWSFGRRLYMVPNTIHTYIWLCIYVYVCTSIVQIHFGGKSVRQ